MAPGYVLEKRGEALNTFFEVYISPIIGAPFTHALVRHMLTQSLKESCALHRRVT